MIVAQNQDQMVLINNKCYTCSKSLIIVFKNCKTFCMGKRIYSCALACSQSIPVRSNNSGEYVLEGPCLSTHTLKSNPGI